MSKHFRQENTSFFSPLTESFLYEKTSKMEEKPDNKNGVCHYLARYHPLLNEESP